MHTNQCLNKEIRVSA